jgi:hypothetical protein
MTNFTVSVGWLGRVFSSHLRRSVVPDDVPFAQSCGAITPADCSSFPLIPPYGDFIGMPLPIPWPWRRLLPI